MTLVMIYTIIFVCLFVLRFNVPVNNVLVMSGRSHRFQGFNEYSREFMCLAQGHNEATHVGIDPVAVVVELVQG